MTGNLWFICFRGFHRTSTQHRLYSTRDTLQGVDKMESKSCVEQCLYECGLLLPFVHLLQHWSVTSPHHHGRPQIGQAGAAVGPILIIRTSQVTCDGGKNYVSKKDLYLLELMLNIEAQTSYPNSNKISSMHE